MDAINHYEKMTDCPLPGKEPRAACPEHLEVMHHRHPQLSITQQYKAQLPHVEEGPRDENDHPTLG